MPRTLALLPRPSVMALDAAYLCTALPVGIVTFTAVVTGLSLAAGLAITIVGLPILIATLWLCRLMGDAERWRTGWVVRPAPRRAHRRWSDDGAWSTLKRAVGDGGAWLDTLWGALLLPLGIAGFTVAMTLWSVALGLLTSPIWYWALPGDRDSIALVDSTALGWTLLRVVIGLALVPVAAWACRGLAEGTARAARAILG